MTYIPGINAVEQFVVIDDDQLSLFLCKTVIQKGMDIQLITTFYNPLEAVHYFETVFINDPLPTVILLDINMPELSGWEVLDKLNSLDEQVKKHLMILMLSSSIDPRDKQQAKIHPLVSGYLEKPLTTQSIREILSTIQNKVSTF